MNVLNKVMKKLTSESIVTEHGEKITSWKETDGYYHQSAVRLNLKDAKVHEGSYKEYIEYLISLGYEWSRKVLTINDVKILDNKVIVECDKGKYAIRGDKQKEYGNGYKVTFKLFDNENKELSNNTTINVTHYNSIHPSDSINIIGNNNSYSTFSNGLFRFGQGIEINEKTTTLTFTISDDKFIIDKEKSSVLSNVMNLLRNNL